MKITLSNTLPAYPAFVEGIRRAPDRGYTLTSAQTVTALKNALRYIPTELHEQLIPEFMEELRTRGRIYGYRFRPTGDLKAKPIDEYRGKCIEGKAFQVMIDNNLCFDIALYPYELVTYGETGQVCQNWMQYRLIKQYLEELTQEQTLVIESGHPLGLFRSRPDAPRLIITNAMMVGQCDNQRDWHIAMQMGVANYGQMTAGGWMYIGPQGIVHGTFNTLLNAGRMKLGIPQDKDLRGHLFVSSGLGGMSGAQPKAAEIAGLTNGVWSEDAVINKLGIKQRYLPGPDDGTQEMGAKAALKCLENTGVDMLPIVWLKRSVSYMRRWSVESLVRSLIMVMWLICWNMRKKKIYRLNCSLIKPLAMLFTKEVIVLPD